MGFDRAEMAAREKRAARNESHRNRFRRYRTTVLKEGETANVHTPQGLFTLDTNGVPTLCIPRGFRLMVTADPSLFTIERV
jgi:hypothetical protein